ncbi:hypothetical protein ABK046_43530 [Streptomyces caeruleatus]
MNNQIAAIDRNGFMSTHWTLVAFVKRHRSFIWGFTIAWLISHWGGVAELWAAASNWVALAAIFVAFEVMFIAGLLVVVAAAARRLVPGPLERSRAWMTALGAFRRDFRATIDAIRDDRMFKVGLYLNWIGAAMVAGVLPLLLIPLLLPATSWPLMVTPAIDLLLTFASRMTLQQPPSGVDQS